MVFLLQTCILLDNTDLSFVCANASTLVGADDQTHQDTTRGLLYGYLFKNLYKWNQSILHCNPSRAFYLSKKSLDSFIRKFGIRQENYFDGFEWHD